MNEKQGNRLHICMKLFLNMLQISTFTFGGGFVIVTLLKRKFCDQLGWISQQEMLDLTAMAQSAPGAIAVNTAVLVGRRVAGLPGILAAFTGTILPPMVILSILSLIYNAFAQNRIVALMLHGMQAGVAAVIVDTAYGLGAGVVKERDWIHGFCMLLAFAAVFFFKVSAIYILIGAAAVGGLRAVWNRKKVRQL